MTSPGYGPPLPWALAAAFVLASIALALYGLRLLRRRERHRSRHEVRRLGATFEAHLAGATDPTALRGATRSASDGGFWTALEGFSVRLGRDEWLRLSAALERDPHAAAERRALRDDSPWRRVLAARRLGLARSPASKRALRAALRRGPEVVTLAAAQALARYGDRAALRWLLSHPGALARRSHATLVALLRSFGRPGLRELHASLERSEDAPYFDRAAIEVLGLLRYRRARAAIERRLESEEPELRVAAARALGAMGSIECATALLAALGDEAWQVRAQAARSLGRIPAPVAVEALTLRLGDPSWWVRRHAAYALAEIGQDGHASLREVVRTSLDPYAREIAQEALENGRHRRIA